MNNANKTEIPDTCRTPWSWAQIFAAARLGRDSFDFEVAVETRTTITLAPR